MTEHMSVCSSGLKRESYRESGGLAVNLSIMRLYLKLYVCVCVRARVCALHKVTHLLYLCTQSNPTQPSEAAEQHSRWACRFFPVIFFVFSLPSLRPALPFLPFFLPFFLC